MYISTTINNIIKLDMHYASIHGIIITKMFKFFQKAIFVLMFSKFAFLYQFLVFFSSFKG